MKNLTTTALLLSALLTSSLSASSYENGSTGTTEKWDIFDSNPAGATISNIYDEDKHSNVIVFNGTGTDNGYRIGRGSTAWNDMNHSVVKWSMNYSENFYVYLSVKTTNGNKTLYYSPSNVDTGISSSGTYIHHGLGTDANNGTWQTFNRDLEADLQEYDYNNSIISVNAFLIRGSGKVDDIELINTMPEPEPVPEYVIYEDGESNTTSGWDIYDKDPSGATISIINDVDKNSNVIELNGDATNNGYRLGHNTATSPKAWNNTDHKSIRWSMNFNEVYYLYVAIETSKGSRMMQYTSGITDKGLNGKYIHHGLGTESRDGTWQTFTRDLEADLKEFESDNTITSVNGLLIKGSGMVDDVVLLKDMDTVTTSNDNEIITHNGFIYGTVTSPYTQRVWLDRNLGASKTCATLDDGACYGGLYQWGRNTDGHEKSNSTTTTIEATDINNVDNSNFILTGGDWANVDLEGYQRSTNWSKTDGSSVCPVGYRVPTIKELKSETIDLGYSSSLELFQNFLKIPGAGYREMDVRYDSGGVLQGVDSWSGVWSSDVSGEKSYAINNDTISGNYYDVQRTYGYSVRCIKDDIVKTNPCGGTTNTVTVERGPVFHAVVTDANGQVAISVKNSNKYTFSTHPECPITATGGQIDANYNGIIDNNDFASPIPLIANNGLNITPMTTYISTLNNEDTQTLADTIGTTIDKLYNLPSQASGIVVAAINAAFGALVEKDLSTDSSFNIKNTFDNYFTILKGAAIANDNVTSDNITDTDLVEMEAIFNNLLNTLTDAEVAEINNDNITD